MKRPTSLRARLDSIKPDKHPLLGEIKKRNLRLRKLAHHLHVPLSTFSNYLNGYNAMPEDLRKQIEEILAQIDKEDRG